MVEILYRGTHTAAVYEYAVIVPWYTTVDTLSLCNLHTMLQTMTKYLS